MPGIWPGSLYRATLNCLTTRSVFHYQLRQAASSELGSFSIAAWLWPSFAKRPTFVSVFPFFWEPYGQPRKTDHEGGLFCCS